MQNAENYFPDRYASKRYFTQKMLKEFKEYSFDPDFMKNIDDDNELDDLREFIRQPVNEWKKDIFLPPDVLAERDDILLRLHNKKKENKISTKDKLKGNESHDDIMQSSVWNEWINWLAKAKNMITAYPKLEQETKIARDYIRFYRNGRNIFEISSYLRKLLENTEVGNIRFKDFTLPYETIYFHFDPLPGLEYPIEYYEEKFDAYLAEPYDFTTDEEEDDFYDKKKYFLEGAFVSITRENCIDIQLCFKDPNDNFSNNINIINDHRFPTFDFTLCFGIWSQNERKTIFNEETTFNQSTVIFSDFWDKEEDIGEIKFEKLNRLTNEPENCYESEWKEYVLMDKALKLIVNCICYINTNENDLKLSATNKQANELLQELSRTNKSQARNKIIQKISKYSYSKIHLLGTGLKEYYENQNTGIEVEPHWRRGHWRKQPFGKNLSDTKLIWIKPTIVKKDKGNPQKGHIYEL